MTSTATSTVYGNMFRSFGLKENPFSVSPDQHYLYCGKSYEIALAELMFGIESHRGLLVITGEAGTGKTTLMRHFLRWLKEKNCSSSYIFHTHLRPGELLEFILEDFGVAVESTKKTDLLTRLHHWLEAQQTAGDSPVIVIDEAQALSLRTLGELNQLLNLENARGKLVQIVLAGQPELEEKLRRPELRALRQRIMVRCRLPLLTLEETGEYIASRLRGAGGTGEHIFPPKTIETIYSFASGVPRVVNLLCEHALIGAYAQNHTVVSPENVGKVAAEFDMAGAPFAISDLDAVFPPRVSSRDAIEQHAINDAHAATEMAATSAGTSVPAAEAPAAIVARNVPVSEPPAVVENLVAAEASIIADSIAANRPPPIGNMPITEAPVLAEHVGAELLEEPHKEVPEQVSEIAAANSISEIAAASSEASFESTAAGESEAPVEIEASNAPPHVPPLEEITVAPDVEVEAPPIAEPSLGIPTVAAMAAAYEEAASGAAAQPAAANSSAPVLGPQLVKNVRPTPAVKSFAKPTPRKANRRAVTYGGWRKRSGWMKRTLRGPFYIYMREVAESFVRDWRHFAASFTSQMSTFPRITLAGSGSFRHSVIEPIREWLAKPMSSRTNPPGPRSSSSATERQRKS